MNKLISGFRAYFENLTRKKIFKVCLPAFILAVVFAVASFFPMYLGKRADIENSNTLIIDTATKSLDDFFKGVDEVYRKLEASIEGVTFYGSDGIISEGGEAIKSLTENMSRTLMGNNYIEEIVILKKNEDDIITTGGVMPKRDFFGKYYVSDVYSVHFFDNLTTDYMSVKVVPSASYRNLEKYPSEDPENFMTCVKRYHRENISIILFISTPKFVKVGNLTSFGDSIRFKIYDNNSSVIFSSSDSEYRINIGALNGDFKKKSIKLGAKKYYITKSDYNYFYYVAEVEDILLVIFLFSVILITAGFLLSLFLLMKRIKGLADDVAPAFGSLDIPFDEGKIEELGERIEGLKKGMNENAVKLESLSDEIKNGIFLKTATSSSFYSRYKKTVDGVFYDLLDCQRIFILSIETIRENIKKPRFEIEKTKEFLGDIPFVFIEEQTKKHLFVIGCDEGESKKIIEAFTPVTDEIRGSNMEILVCVSREFDGVANLYDAFRDIRICRSYRGINDRTSVIDTDNIAGGSRIYLPPDFKEELTAKIMAGEDNATREYIKGIFDINIKNNISLSKFEFMLRQLLSTVIDAFLRNPKNSSDLYELEQMFLAGIEQLKENHDVYGIVNNFINLVHLGINTYEEKKSTLNRTDVIKYINAGYTGDLYLEKIAAEFSTTSKYFSNYFKKEFGVGFNEYVTNLRISKAKKLLCETDKGLMEISRESGYINQATFAAAFKKVTGLPPGKYRDINR
ncbi:MAG: helix-turn-helix domain-containing protein [Ruminococcaceae bacterium]|nr:helix-turn-helix domain-containing protein [Oscillospiraceae bacterium]